MRPKIALFAAIFITTLAFPALAAAFGQLAPGAGGCVAQPVSTPARNQTQGCASGAGLRGAAALAVSPDGRNVYVVSNYTSGEGWGAVAEFARNPVTGALKQLGCVSSDSTNGYIGSNGACGLSPGLIGASAVAVSPNGRTVYVGASRFGNIDAFTRDPASGQLTALRGCYTQIANLGSVCPAAHVFTQSTSLAVGLSGTWIYAGSAQRGAISQLPDSGFGLVTPPALPGVFNNPCISVAGPENACANGAAMNSIDSLSLNGAGTVLYAASTASAAVDSFNVDPASGALTQAGCLMRNPPPGPCETSRLLDSPVAVSASRDGRRVYVADSGGSGGDRLVELILDPTTGMLADSSCYEEAPLPGSGGGGGGANDPCRAFPGLDSVRAVAASSDGTTVYAAGDNTLSQFVLDPATGALIGTACAVRLDPRCSNPVGLGGARGVVVSPDDRNVYVAASSSGAVTAWGPGASVTSGRARGAIAYLKVACPAAAGADCAGNVTLGRLSAQRAHIASLSSTAWFVLRPGSTATVRVRLAQRLAAITRAHHLIVAQAIVWPVRGGGGGSSRTVALIPAG